MRRDTGLGLSEAGRLVSLRLGFHYHIPSALSADGAIRMQGHLGRFVDSLAVQCEKIVCFQHSSAPSDPQPDYTVQSENVELVGIGPHSRIPQRVLRARLMTAQVRRSRQHIDALLIRGPTPLLSHMAASIGPVPVVLLLVGDYVAGVDTLPQPWWRKEIIRAWTKYNKWGQDRVASRALTFVNSRVLFDEYRLKGNEVVETRTTTLNEQDFLVRSDSCSSPPFKLLYTGRLDAAKGLMDIAEAVRLLRGRGSEIELHLVGWPQRGDDVLKRLQAFSKTHDIPLIYHGYKSVGPDLFQHYRDADLFVIASRGSEGFPRSLWEAMAHSVPVVATAVGSIPHYLEDKKTALLVSPSDPTGLAESIGKLIDDNRLRNRLISNARDIARPNTLQVRAKEMIGDIERWLDREWSA